MDSRSENPKLDYLFHPRSIAIAGVSSDMNRESGGRDFLEFLVENGFKGKIYPVNPKGGQIFGLEIYTTIKDIPDSVDYVISAVPARYTQELLLDCSAKGVKSVHVFSAGFGEISDKGGKQLESQLLTIARQKGMRILGPNCIGIYCPETGLSFDLDLPKQIGFVGLISQSGSNCIYAIREAATRGVYVSKAVSYGNAYDLDESDFIEYFTHDPKTKVIAGYIEGIRDGTRLARVLRQAAKVKPTIIYKAGATEAGARAVASHSGAMAGSDRIWEGFLKQVGAIQAHSIDELVDLIVLFNYTSPLQGRNTAIVGIGGGLGVQAANECRNAGLAVPLLPTETQHRLSDLYGTEAGGSFRNPIDLYFGTQEIFEKATGIIAECPQNDLLLMYIIVGIRPKTETNLLRAQVGSIIASSKLIGKRTALVLLSMGPTKFSQAALETQTALWEAGFPVFPSFLRAATAISKFIEYHTRHPETRAYDRSL